MIWQAHDSAVADEHALALLVVIMGAGLVLRALLLDAPLGLEEAAHGAAARGVLRGGLPVLPSGLLDARTPVFHWLLGLSFFAGGDSLLTGRLLGVAFGTAAIGAAYLLARRTLRSRGAALLGALLLAVDPLSISWTARMAPTGLLQLATLGGLAALEHQWQGGDPGARWRVGSAVALALACLAHPLFVLTLPAAALVVAVRGRARRSPGPRAGLRPLLPLAVAAAVVVALPLAVGALAARRGATGDVGWSSGDATTLGQVGGAFAGFYEALLARTGALGLLEHAGSARIAAMLALAAVAVLGLALRRGRAGGLRLVAYGAGTLALVAVAASQPLVPAWAAHVWALTLLILAGAAWPSAGEALSRRALAWMAAAALAAAAAAGLRVNGGPPAVALAALALPVLAGAALDLHERASRQGVAARGLLVGAALSALVGVTPARPGAAPGWQQAGLALAPRLLAGDRLLVHGDQAPVVWWSTGRVDAVVPSYDVLWAVDDHGQPYEAITGARIAGDLGQVTDAVRGAHVVYVTGPSRTGDPAWTARVERPVDAWLRERLPLARVHGPVEVREGRALPHPHPPRARPAQ